MKEMIGRVKIFYNDHIDPWNRGLNIMQDEINEWFKSMEGKITIIKITQSESHSSSTTTTINVTMAVWYALI